MDYFNDVLITFLGLELFSYIAVYAGSESFQISTKICARYNSYHIIQFAADTTVVGLVSNEDESTYREVNQLILWCDNNNLSLNVSKTKEITVDFMRKQMVHNPFTINGSTVDSVISTKFCHFFCCTLVVRLE